MNNKNKLKICLWFFSFVTVPYGSAAVSTFADADWDAIPGLTGMNSEKALEVLRGEEIECCGYFWNLKASLDIFHPEGVALIQAEMSAINYNQEAENAAYHHQPFFVDKEGVLVRELCLRTENLLDQAAANPSSSHKVIRLLMQTTLVDDLLENPIVNAAKVDYKLEDILKGLHSGLYKDLERIRLIFAEPGADLMLRHKYRGLF